MVKAGVLWCALALVAAACGASTSNDEASTEETTSDSAGEVATDRAEGDALGSDNRESGEPVRGGTLVYGIEADTANPWAPYSAACAISCMMIQGAVADPLFITREDGEVVPYLAEAVEPSEDYTAWTITIRDGITFHDGTPVDGEAIAYNIDACRNSPLRRSQFIGLDTVEFEGQTVTLTYAEPDAVGPKAVLREQACGWMMSKAWLETLPNNPLLSDEEKAAATGDPTAPVGSGPFKFVSYTPGNGNAFVAERYEDYWRGDGPNSVTGEGLPYLDRVELVVAVDIQGRSNGLQGGQFDIIHTANADEIAKFESNPDFFTIQANAYGETSYILINSAQGENPTLAALRGEPVVEMDPAGANLSNPLIHLSCRKALAHALDRDRWAAEREAGIATPANGPFPPGSMGYLDDSGYPTYDVEAARAEWETCKQDVGTPPPIKLQFNTTNDAFNVESNELTASMWRDAFGDEIEVSITPIEQGQYITLALTGQFQAQGWRSHGGVDPTEQWYRWTSATATPIAPDGSELSLNWGRIQDPEIDAQFDIIRHDPDPEARKAAAQQVNRLFAQNVWNFWYTWTLWGVIADPAVQDITSISIPGETEMSVPIIAGAHRLAQVWCLEGTC
ncbi:MAG: ABC transporter substrate-binding protein [Acidimicrobiales bacterium]